MLRVTVKLPLLFALRTRVWGVTLIQPLLMPDTLSAIDESEPEPVFFTVRVKDVYSP
jgi:hypothetical protein